MSSTIRCKMENGQVVYQLSLPCEAKEVEEIEITGSFMQEPSWRYIRENRSEAPGDVKSYALDNGSLTIDTVPFSYKSTFSVNIITAEGRKVMEKADFEEVITDGEDRFSYEEEGIVRYRLYSPEASEKRPLILYLHGGGNGGTLEGRDNRKQLLADFGPIHFSEAYADMYVMAPQCVEIPFDPQKMGRMMNAHFADMKPDTENGWSRSYLGKVCDIIRRMVREGKVDEERIYVTGLSMGGAGTIRAMSTGSDLFAACAPICPTMTPETYDILRTMQQPVWVSTAYVDHTIYRHKYITDAILQLKDAGHKNAHLTIYSPEDLAKYDIGIGEKIPYEMLFRMNHASWVVTYHDEYGIMSWLLNQRKRS